MSSEILELEDQEKLLQAHAAYLESSTAIADLMQAATTVNSDDTVLQPITNLEQATSDKEAAVSRILSEVAKVEPSLRTSYQAKRYASLLLLCKFVSNQEEVPEAQFQRLRPSYSFPLPQLRKSQRE